MRGHLQRAGEYRAGVMCRSGVAFWREGGLRSDGASSHRGAKAYPKASLSGSRAAAFYCDWTRGTMNENAGADRAKNGRVAREKSLQNRNARKLATPSLQCCSAGQLEHLMQSEAGKAGDFQDSLRCA